MGMFDTVYVSGDVAAALRLACERCGAAPLADAEWQTKSLDPSMLSYVLRHDEGGAVRLYLLDPLPIGVSGAPGPKRRSQKAKRWRREAASSR